VKRLFLCISLVAQAFALDATVMATHIVKGKVLGTTGYSGVVAYSEMTFVVDSVFKNVTGEKLDTIKIFQTGADFGNILVQDFDGDGFKNFPAGSEMVLSLTKYYKQFKMLPFSMDFAVANLDGNLVTSYSFEGLTSTSASIRSTSEKLKSMYPGSESTSDFYSQLKQALLSQPKILAQNSNIAILVKVLSSTVTTQGTEIQFQHVRTLKGNWNLSQKTLLMPDSKTLLDYGVTMPKTGDRVLLFYTNEQKLLTSSPWFFSVDKNYALTAEPYQGVKIESLFSTQGGSHE